MKKLINITSPANLETIKEYVDCNTTQAVNFALACVARAILAGFPKYKSERKQWLKTDMARICVSKFRHIRSFVASHGKECLEGQRVC